MAKSSGLARWLGAALLVSAAMMPIQHTEAQERGQARSMVVSRYGIVAAESPLAAQAGVEILERGGNRVDAAIPANAMMGVLGPVSHGIGGDLFAMVFDAQYGRLYGAKAGD